MSSGDGKKKKGFSRRKFLVRSAVGVGVILGAGYISRKLAWRYFAGVANTIELPYTNSAPLNAWFEVTPEGKITLYSPKVEMGQGTLTGLAQLAADELEINMSQLHVVQADSISGNIDPFATGGSTSISGLWVPLRELAATFREMLLQEASRQTGIDRSQISVAEGVISAGQKSISYGELVSNAGEWKVPDTPALKQAGQFRLIGKPIERVDLREKVVGDPIFGLDVELPEMVHGSILRPGKVGAKLVSADTSEAATMPGVIKVLQEDDFIGVVAETRMQAEIAKQAIQAEWEVDETWTSEMLEDRLRVGKGEPVVIQKKGNPENALQEGEIVESEFFSPIGAHAQLEPNVAVADVAADAATIYVSTQVVKITRNEVARRLGLRKKQVNIIPTFLGGGFGRRLHSPHAMYAAVMSREVGRPVKYFFDRKEEFQHDTFRPPTHHVLRANVVDGRIAAIEHHVSSGDVMFGSALIPGMITPIIGSDVGAWRGGMIQYGAIPDYRAVSWRVRLPFATSWWRSLGLLANTFAIESFMDQLALQAGKDPVQFRLEHIQDDDRGHRLSEVIKAAADKSGYKDTVVDGIAMGFAVSTDANTPVAQVAEVSLDGDKIKVHKVTCVIDPGLAVNPDQIKAQCEGAIIMGMSASCYEEMKLENGELHPVIYGPYRMAMMRDAPREIDVTILQNAETPGAVGEPPLGPIGAAIANALYRLTGHRIQRMPFIREGFS